MRGASDYALVSAWRRVSLAGGIASVVLGLILIAWPGKTVLVVGGLVGIYLLVLGCVRIAGAVTGGPQVIGGEPAQRSGRRSGYRALAGAIYALTGVIILANLHESLKFVAVVLGALLICAGLSEAMSGFARVGGAWIRAAAIWTGVINIVLGVSVLVWPRISLPILVWILALWFIALGVIQLYHSLLARKAERALRERPSRQTGAELR